MSAQIHQTIVVLADIGGYTRFITHHRTSVLHAEKAITELLESVISASQHPLTLNKLEGDAALFYAIADTDPAIVAQDVARQVRAFFSAFAAKRAELRACNVCQCSACLGFEQLKIKAIIHVGEVLHKKVDRFEELAGEPVIVAHRLLKNSVRHEQYVLTTSTYSDLIGDVLGKGTPEIETCEGIGRVPVVVYPTESDQPASESTVFKKIGQLWRYEIYMISRILGRKISHPFSSLAGL